MVLYSESFQIFVIYSSFEAIFYLLHCDDYNEQSIFMTREEEMLMNLVSHWSHFITPAICIHGAWQVTIFVA